MLKIILINGKKRAGKDYFASLLKSELEDKGYTAEILSFAHPMKDIIAKTFNISLEQLDRYKNYCSEISCEGEQISDFRLILQRFGTEGMKPWFGNDVWANLLYSIADKTDCDYVLVPDFRFLSEYREDALTIKVQNKDVEKACADSHASENELSDFVFDLTVDNTGYSLTTEKVREFIENELHI